jgi:thiamine pyrophosphate-dependent acetolactate synthase large subunit-like protein
MAGNADSGQRTGRRAILEQLTADGAEYLFGNPGTVEQGFLDELRGFPKLKYILALQESIAVGMADGYARAGRRPAFVQLHSGVGLGNGIGMLYQALRGHAPLVVLAGDAGVKYDAMDAQMACDLVAMARPVTKWAGRATDPASVLRLLRRAVRIACTPPLGPVFLNLPLDVLDAPNTEAVLPTVIPSTRVMPDAAGLTELVQGLLKAQRPLLIIGDGVAASGASGEVARLAELLGAPVWGADCSEINIDQRHSCYQGQLGHMFGFHSAELVRDADAVLIIGTYVFPEVFPELGQVFAPGTWVGHIDLNIYEIAKNHPVDFGVAADPLCTLAQLSGEIEAGQTSEQRAAASARVIVMAQRREQTLAKAVAADCEQRSAEPLLPARFMAELAERADTEAIIFDEALTTSPALARYLPRSTPGSFFQTRGGSLGVGLPGALGIQLARPDAQVLAFTGDGGSMYTIQALWTAAKYNIPVKCVVCANGGYQLLKLNIQQYWRERGITEHDFPGPFDISTPPLNAAGIAQAWGVASARVAKPTEIAPALDTMLAHAGPYLIEVMLADEVPPHPVKCGQ